jgi:DNA primase
MDREVVPVPTPRGLIRFEDRLAADIRIVSLPVGRDPDEVIRESPSRWAQLIAQAKPVMDYYFEALTVDLDLGTAKGKAEAVRLLGPLIAEIGDRVQRTHYLQQLGRMVQMDERTLWQQIKRSGGAKRLARPSRPEPPPEEQQEGPLGLDGYCLSLALCYPDLLSQADEALQPYDEEPLRGEDLNRPEDQAILGAWRQWLAAGGAPSARGEFYDTLHESLQGRLDALVRSQEGQPEVPDELLCDQVLDTVTRLRLQSLQREIHKLRFLLEDTQDARTAAIYGPLITQATVRRRRLEQSMNDRSMSGRRQREDATVRVPYTEE